MDGILVVNKEKNMTSRDVVNIVCKKLNTKHIGHTGTLDPIATGVLVLGVNSGCKIIDLLTSDIKEYIACVKIGILTDTLDITGNIIDSKEIDNFDYNKIENVINNFKKEYMQEVPKYSAVRINGKRLYEYARENVSVSLPKRLVKIYELKLLEINKNDNTFKIYAKVSKGTYIRSLIRDLGNSLDMFLTMSELKRIKQGIFDIKDSYSLDEIDENVKLISIKDSLSNYEQIVVDDKIKKMVLNGRILKFDTLSSIVLVLDNNKNLIAIYKRYDKDNSLMKPLKVFKEDYEKIK